MARVKAIFILLLGAMALPAAPGVLSFRNDVMAVLAKAGCNAGACHGNANGGFKLSLRGEDFATDFLTLTRGQFGRRIDAIEPERSLLLRKATAVVAHKGGQRFKTGSREFQILRDWMTAGTPNDSATAPAVVRLQVEAAQRIVRESKKELAIKVRAFFADDTSRDVTEMRVMNRPIKMWR